MPAAVLLTLFICDTEFVEMLLLKGEILVLAVPLGLELSDQVSTVPLSYVPNPSCFFLILDIELTTHTW